MALTSPFDKTLMFTNIVADPGPSCTEIALLPSASGAELRRSLYCCPVSNSPKYSATTVAKLYPLMTRFPPNTEALLTESMTGCMALQPDPVYRVPTGQMQAGNAVESVGHIDPPLHTSVLLWHKCNST